jgi:hypothetical protein
VLNKVFVAPWPHFSAVWRDCGEMLEAMARGRKRSYTQAELAEVADGLTRLLDTVRRGELAAGPGTVSRLEGAMIALRSLAEGRSLNADELLGATAPEHSPTAKRR